ncbi:MAG: cytochrome c5 family protein [Legionellales bacterium]|nr:cytochrome c5 family protein [Legionellales bacterium]
MNKWQHKIMIVLILVASALAGFFLSLFLHQTHHQSNFTVPSDTVVIKTFHYPVSFVEQLKHHPHAGKEIYYQYCHACHAAHPEIAINAPRINDKATWEALSKMGMPQLFQLAAHGVAAMPARGGCFECSDQQLHLAIEYMLSRAQVKIPHHH